MAENEPVQDPAGVSGSVPITEDEPVKESNPPK